MRAMSDLRDDPSVFCVHPVEAFARVRPLPLAEQLKQMLGLGNKVPQAKELCVRSRADSERKGFRYDSGLPLGSTIPLPPGAVAQYVQWRRSVGRPRPGRFVSCGASNLSSIRLEQRCSPEELTRLKQSRPGQGAMRAPQNSNPRLCSALLGVRATRNFLQCRD